MDKQPEIEREVPTEVCESSSLSTQERSNNNNTWRRDLNDAVGKGDWNKTESLINSHPEALSGRLFREATILHTAVLHSHLHHVQQLVKKMSKEDTQITLPGVHDSTALHLASTRKSVKIAEVLVKKNPDLLCIPDKYGNLPVTRASTLGNKAMVRYLYSVTPKEELKPSKSSNGVRVLGLAIAKEDYDFALHIHQDLPELTFPDESGYWFKPLRGLASKSSAFPSGNQLKFWQRWIYNCINVQRSYADNNESSVNKAPGFYEQIYNTKLRNKQALKLLRRMSAQLSTLNASEREWSRDLTDALVDASQFGIVEFVIEILRSNPTLLWEAIPGAIFSKAVEYRQEKIWNLYYSLGVSGILFGSEWRSRGNTLLHVAAQLAPSSRLNKVPGPAMQMQWELQWFKEVETIIPPSMREHTNRKGKTASALFTEQHKDLIEKAEKWMKDTASSCMVVATLIATVMFAAAFSVPGGNDDTTGLPKFQQQKSFTVFIVADALSLFSSTTSILMFLSIITSRYAEEDFLESLPKRLIIGFATLFFSIATMMMAFSATLVIVLKDRYEWAAIPIYFLASVPVTLFALLQLPLFVGMVKSTYGPSIFQKQTESLFDSVPTQRTQTQCLDP